MVVVRTGVTPHNGAGHDAARGVQGLDRGACQGARDRVLAGPRAEHPVVSVRSRAGVGHHRGGLRPDGAGRSKPRRERDGNDQSFQNGYLRKQEYSRQVARLRDRYLCGGPCVTSTSFRLLKGQYRWPEACSHGFDFALRPFCDDDGARRGPRSSRARLGREHPVRTNGATRPIPDGRPSSRDHSCAERGPAGDLEPRDVARADPARVRNRGKGTNGFTCLVERSWMSPFDSPEFWNWKMRGPICYNPAASRTVLLYTLRGRNWRWRGRPNRRC